MDHDTVLFFSPDGIARSLKAYQIPQSSRTAAGTPLSQVVHDPAALGCAVCADCAVQTSEAVNLHAA